MNKYCTIQGVLAVLLLISACSQKTTERRYAHYINDPDNKIMQRIKVGEIQASMKLMPPEYRSMINKRWGNDIKATDEGLCYFNAKFEKTTGEKPSKEKILYLDFDMQNDFMLRSGIDSASPIFCQRIENGISGSYEYMLAFERPGKSLKDENDFSIVYNDKIFGIGAVEFVYNNTDLKKIPKLKSNTSE